MKVYPSDASRFGPGIRFFFFIHLQHFRDYFLVLVLAENGFSFALASIKRSVENDQVFYRLGEIGWLTLGETAESKPGFEVSSQRLIELYDYCISRASVFTIERQLFSRKINYSTFKPPNTAQDFIPLLCIDSTSLASNATQIAFKKIAVQIVASHQQPTSVSRTRYESFNLYDLTTGTLYCRYPSMSNCEQCPSQLQKSHIRSFIRSSTSMRSSMY